MLTITVSPLLSHTEKGLLAESNIFQFPSASSSPPVVSHTVQEVPRANLTPLSFVLNIRHTLDVPPGWRRQCCASSAVDLQGQSSFLTDHLHPGPISAVYGAYPYRYFLVSLKIMIPFSVSWSLYYFLGEVEVPFLIVLKLGISTENDLNKYLFFASTPKDFSLVHLQWSIGISRLEKSPQAICI